MIFIDEKNVFENEIHITGQDHVHISRVLRAKINEKIVVNDEKIVYNVIICEILKDKTVCEILDKTPITSEISPKIHVYISATKGDKMELVVQKVTELGAFSVTPFVSKRSIVKFDDKSKVKKVERLKTIAKEASNQCKSLFVTRVCDILSFGELVKKIEEHEVSCVLYENENKTTFKEVVSKEFDEIALIIGPEGGFEIEEINKLAKVGANSVTLGKRILRAETAPITAVSAIMYEKNNLN